MMSKNGARTLYRTVYRIAVRSELSDRYASAFEGMRMETKDGDTILIGEVVDQPHLHVILERINGLGLELLSVQALQEVLQEALQEDTNHIARRHREP
jgi:hypothetical protein